MCKHSIGFPPQKNFLVFYHTFSKKEIRNPIAVKKSLPCVKGGGFAVGEDGGIVFL
jgi:hypothetical protein